MWPDVREAFATVWRLATVLANEDQSSGAVVRRRYHAVLAALTRDRASYGQLAGALDHFGKVTQSYRRGLFRCYDVDGLPRTNNQLEQFFGSYRYHERRCSGRKVACPGTVVRGSVRLIAAAATRSRPIGVPELIPSDVTAWRELRRSLQQRQAVRAHGRRFRRDAVAYLRSLEDALINQVLPP
jgi:hypothetical protein